MRTCVAGAEDNGIGICGVLEMRMRGASSCEVEAENGLGWRRLREGGGGVGSRGHIIKCRGFGVALRRANGPQCGEEGCGS